MKTILHKADSRGGADHGWLKTKHSFSFANWYDPRRMGFGALRVLNDDWIAPQRGFGMHHHDNFEIITIVMKGAVSHEDDIGNNAKVGAGEVQVMSAGIGVTHSEHNREDEPLELFQLWIETNKPGTEPRYDQQRFDASERKNKLQTLVSGGSEGLMIYQDAKISLLDLDPGKEMAYKIPGDHGVYVFVIEGDARIAEIDLSRRDALGVSETEDFSIAAHTPASLLLIEVPLI